jgi:hypothetical protein
MLGRLSRFDAHVKANSSVQVKTVSGAAISIVASLVIMLLLLSEWNVYRAVEVRNHMYVDPASTSELIPVNLRVTFPELTCADVRIEVEDPRKEETEEQAKNVQKIPYVAPYKKEADKTGTWDKGVTADNAPGCTLEGSIDLTKVAGSLQVALGNQQNDPFGGGLGGLIYSFSMSDLNTFNASHTIHHLSFGPKIPGVTNPLDGVHNEVEQGTGQYMYYVKVVPTDYVSLSGEVTRSNQFSVTEHFVMVDFMAGQFPQPGVFIKYDFSPIMVEYRESTKSIGHLITNVCAIVGGVFTSFSILSGVVHRAEMALKKED